jgi:ABC-2 type transport system permease protein
MRGLWQLTWIETKVFLREPLGLIGAVAVPIVVFLVLGRIIGRQSGSAEEAQSFLRVGLPVLAALLIVLSEVLSLVTIISIYREGGILKRLRATPLQPPTILGAHVMVKVLLTAFAWGLMLLFGWRYYPVSLDVHVVSFTIALLISTVSLLSIGFVIASIVPTARFAQPIGSLILYPMISVSGLFTPIELMPPALQTIARAMPLTYAVSLMKGIWRGDPWVDHLMDIGALAVVFVACTALSAKIFRWE